MGWSAVVVAGTAMLASGVYVEIAWVALAVAGNLAPLVFLVVRRWQPIRKVRNGAASAWNRLRAHGNVGWDLAIALCLSSAVLLASRPPEARDQLVYHLALPRFWSF